MKIRFLWLLLLACSVAAPAAAQNQKMVRLYEDNDLFNVGEKATDKAYSNGTRADFFYQSKKELSSFIYALMPKAGNNSSNTLGWGLMQMMITPTQIDKTIPEAGDFHYSGSLFLVHTFHSANEKQKLNLQTEWIVGVMGPPSLAKETQIWVHRLIGSQRPMGWDYQLPTDLLLNYNLTIEKAVLAYKDIMEVIISGQAFTGTMLHGATVSGTLRFGKLNPYFKGLVHQQARHRKWTWYCLVKPGVELTLYNALLEGGFFNTQLSSLTKKEESVDVRRLANRVDFGVGASINKVSVSFTQKTMFSIIKGLPKHAVGNLSLTYSW